MKEMLYISEIWMRAPRVVGRVPPIVFVSIFLFCEEKGRLEKEIKEE